MNLVKTALALAASMLLVCGATFAGDDDAKAKRDRIMDTLEKMLQSERDNIRKHVEKIVDDEIKSTNRSTKNTKDAKNEEAPRDTKKTAPRDEKSTERPFVGLFLEDAQTEQGGASVREVVEGSPAAKAGVKTGDVIVKLNGTQMGASKDVIAAVGQKHPGDEVKLDIVRGKDPVSLSLKLGTRPAEAAASFPGNGDDDDEKADEGKKDEGKKSPSADDLRARIRKFMDKMNGGKDEEKDAKKDSKKGAKDLLDRALDGDKKGDKKAEKKDEDDDDEGAKAPGDMKDLSKMAKKLMDELLKGQKGGGGGGDEGEDKGDGQDDPMAGIMKWLQSDEAQKLLEQLQPMIEKLMQDENFQKLLEQLQQGGGFNPPDEGNDEKGDELSKPGKQEKPEKKEEKPAKTEKSGGAFLGLSPTELTDDLRDQLGVDGGVVVGDVVAEGPAAKAGLKKNDVITAIDGTDIAGPADIRKIMAKHKPGDSVELSILRKGKKKTLTVELGKKGAMAPTNKGDRRQAALQGALKDFDQALRVVPEPHEALKKASEDLNKALQAAKPEEKKGDDQQPDPAKWLQQAGQMAKALAGKQELYWNITDKSGKVLWKQRLEPDKMIELGARLGESEAEHAARNPRVEVPKMAKELRDAVRKALHRGESKDGGDCDQ